MSAAAANADRDRRKSAAEAVEAEGVAEKNRRIAAAQALQAEATRAHADALDERAEDLLRQQIISQLPEIVRAASEPLSTIGTMTIIATDGSGTEQVGQSVASQLATSTQIIKDLVGIDLSEIITGRSTGGAVGKAIGENLALDGGRATAPSE